MNKFSIIIFTAIITIIGCRSARHAHLIGTYQHSIGEPAIHVETVEGTTEISGITAEATEWVIYADKTVEKTETIDGEVIAIQRGKWRVIQDTISLTFPLGNQEAIEKWIVDQNCNCLIAYDERSLTMRKVVEE